MDTEYMETVQRTAADIVRQLRQLEFDDAREAVVDLARGAIRIAVFEDPDPGSLEIGENEALDLASVAGFAVGLTLQLHPPTDDDIPMPSATVH